MKTTSKHRASRVKQTLTLFILFLLLNLTFVQALEIRNVHTEDITDTQATIVYETDEPANTIVYHGQDPATLTSQGDAIPTTDHKLTVSNLNAETAYLFKVQSADITDDNSGNLYTFTTLPPDTAPPELTADIPEVIEGTALSFTGTTQPGSSISLTLNNNFVATKTIGKDESIFKFENILLLQDQLNTLTLESKDPAGNKATIDDAVYADVSTPRMILGSIPKVVGERKFTLEINVSENVTIRVMKGTSELTTAQGAHLEIPLTLEEGANDLNIVATDRINHTSTKEISIYADTQDPQITLDFERGREFYESRATTDINGKTDPGADVYLYVFKPQVAEYNPQFDRAYAKTTADENGDYSFNDISFDGRSITDIQLKDLKPRELPSGLINDPIYPFQAGPETEQKAFYIYVIAEDKGGRVGYAKDTVRINSCSSRSFDFSIDSLPQFQGPLRLVPQLMDDGRQEIQATFQLRYLGQNLAGVNKDETFQKGIKIDSIEFEPACTDAMSKDDRFSLGCKLMPRNQPNKVYNNDRSVVYTTWRLLPAAELTKREDDLWNDFKKRQLVFPMRIKVTYYEKEGEKAQSPPKTQFFCYDLGYFVDIPIESEELLPDFLAEEGIDSLNWTINQLQTTRPYVEKAYLISGYSCIGSFLLRTILRGARILTSKMETYYSVVKKGVKTNDAQDDVKHCPVNQNRLYPESTLENWKELWDAGLLTDANFPGKNYEQVVKALQAGQNSDEWNLVSLDKRCPSTATAWKVEAGIDQLYKWSCDRAFCRAVPAGWTSDENIEDIEKVIIKQQQCAATGRGVPLTKIENCREKIKNPLYNQPELQDYTGVCWQTVDLTLYINDESPGADERLARFGIKRDGEEGVYLLTAVGSQLPDLQPKQANLLVFKPQDSETFIVGKDQTCKQVCGTPRKPGYGPDIAYGDTNGCYDERPDDAGTIVLVNPNNPEQKLGQKRGNEEKDNLPRYAAGYTRDCFLKRQNPTLAPGEVGPEVAGVGDLSIGDDGQPILQQCVCAGEKTEESPNKLVRAATKEDKEAGLKEEWFYQQDAIYRESGHRAGTYYNPKRYYTGRDLSGAFGADYILDYIHTNDADKTEYQVNPHTQLLGTVQTVCLSGILKNMKMLENVLIGLRNCLIEAKYTGIHDAGMCKALFTQHVCGLMYKGISSLVGGCTPSTFDDVAKETVFGDIGVFVENGGEAMSESISTSINDLQEDYGNAKLNEYFKGGVEGFAQSICLGMFGYDIPLFTEDFLLDAAYSFPTKTTPLVVPASRELSTFDPAQQTAVYNYEVGAVILAGCKIKRWNVKLKCIGPEDKGNPNLDETCDGQECDCLNINSASPFEGERTRNIPGAAGFNIPSGDLLSVPIESPMRINSHYRYDHVIVELELDASEKGNEELCFDKQYVKANTATFYFPIADRSVGLVAGCRADVTSGRFTCPELSNILGFGGANLEEPFVSCWNDRTQSRMPCDTPNLYTFGDIIKTGVHLNVDGKGYCLKRTVRGVPGITPEENIRAIPTSVTGPFIMEDTVGTVIEPMFGGNSPNIIVDSQRSNSGCNRGPTKINEPTTIQDGERAFKIIPRGNNQISLDIQGAITAQGDFDIVGNRLRSRQDPNKDSFTAAQINEIQFNIGGFVIQNVFENYDQTVPEDKDVCVYRVTRGSTYQNPESRRSIPVRYELYNTDEQGGCTYLQTKAKSTLGPSERTVNIVIQRERSVGGNLHQAFVSNNFESLQKEALRIIELGNGDIDNALAVYYLAAGFVKQRGPATGAELTQNVAINNLLNVFFARTWKNLPQPPYTPETLATPDYQKMKVYLCLVDKSMQSKHQEQCAGVS